jgi:protoheme IX farnesyltransferase
MSQNHKETLLKLREPESVDVGSTADYIALMKPRVMSLVVFTALVGLVMAPGAMHPVMAVAAIALIAVGAGASAALNMWYDADIDALMSRTQDRPVPSGRVTPDAALTFGLWVSGLSVLSMAVMINYLSAALLAFTIFFYAVIYTMFLKRRTAQNIVIGGAAGALPPVIGWAAAANSVSIEPLIYFAIIFFWTPPHFWALALIKNDDYQAANVPMLPVTSGVKSTLTQIVLYAFLLFGVSLLPYALGFSGPFMPAARPYWVACLLPFASAWRWHRTKTATAWPA